MQSICSKRALGESTTILPPLTSKDRSGYAEAKKALEIKENKNMPPRYTGYQ